MTLSILPDLQLKDCEMVAVASPKPPPTQLTRLCKLKKHMSLRKEVLPEPVCPIRRMLYHSSLFLQSHIAAMFGEDTSVSGT